MFDSNQILNKLDNGIIIYDKDENIYFVNQWVRDRVSKSLGQDEIFKYLKECASQRLKEVVSENIKLGKAAIISDRFFKHTYPLSYNNRAIQQKIKITRIRNNDNAIFSLLQIFDMTLANQREAYLIDQNKNIESTTKELEHLNKIASIGRMASGIVHEINNPIAIIRGYDLIYSTYKKNNSLSAEKYEEMHTKIQQMAERIQHIIKGLKIIAHKDTFEFTNLVSIQKLIKDSIELSAIKIKESGVSVEFEELIPDVEIWGDHVQLSQIIINLISNAIDAINHHPSPWIYIFCKRDEKFIKICVKDCGNGIPEDSIAKIFDPFYTSKQIGKGTGLGLSISQKIAEAHRGELYVETAEQNTTFVLKLIDSKHWE